MTAVATHEAELIETDVAIETPEHIVFRYRVAGPGRRALAHVVDQVILILIILASVFLLIVLLAAFGTHADMMDVISALGGLIAVVLFAIEWVYFVAFETLKGGTPGKIALGMRVVTTTGQPIGFAQAAMRNLLRAADAMPFPYAFALAAAATAWFSLLYPAGLLSMLITKRFQRVGDLVAGTMVILIERGDRARQIDIELPSRAEAESLPPTLGLDPDERSALELFLRRKKLGQARELELAEMIAPTLARKHNVWMKDPVRMLALLYDRARSSGRTEGPPSSRGGTGWL